LLAGFCELSDATNLLCNFLLRAAHEFRFALSSDGLRVLLHLHHHASSGSVLLGLELLQGEQVDKLSTHLVLLHEILRAPTELIHALLDLGVDV